MHDPKDILYDRKDIFYIKEDYQYYIKNRSYENKHHQPYREDIFICKYYLCVEGYHGRRYTKDLFGLRDNCLGRKKAFHEAASQSPLSNRAKKARDCCF
jgi:hypothetical protein